MLLPDGRVLVAGGNVGSATPSSAAEIYDPGSNAWSSAPAMPVERYAHHGALLPSGRVLIVGGTSTSLSTTFSVDVFDPALNSWAASADMHFRRVGHAASLMNDGRVLVVGGHNGVFDGVRLPTSEIFQEASAVQPVLGGGRPSVDAFLSYAGTYITGGTSTVPHCTPSSDNPSVPTRITVFFVTGVNGELTFPATAHVTLAGLDITPVVQAQGATSLRATIPNANSVLSGAIEGIVPGTIRIAKDSDRISISCDPNPPVF